MADLKPGLQKKDSFDNRPFGYPLFFPYNASRVLEKGTPGGAGRFVCDSVEMLASNDPSALNMAGAICGGVQVVRRLPDIKAKTQGGEPQHYDRWECECRFCGNAIYISGSNLRRIKPPPQKSCGCQLPPKHPWYRAPHKGTSSSGKVKMADEHDFSI